MLCEASYHIMHFSFKNVDVMFLRNMCHEFLIGLCYCHPNASRFASACHPNAS